MKKLTKKVEQAKKHVVDNKAAYLTAGVVGVVGWKLNKRHVLKLVTNARIQGAISGYNDGMVDGYDEGIDDAIRNIYQAKDLGLIKLKGTDKTTDNPIIKEFVRQILL